MTYLRSLAVRLETARADALLAKAKTLLLDQLRQKGPFAATVETSENTYDWEFPARFNERPACVAIADALAVITVDAGPTRQGVRFRIRRPTGATGPVTIHMIAMEP